MAREYSVDTCRRLLDKARQIPLHRPVTVERYEPGDTLSYEVTGVLPARRARVELRVEKFVGGGFAGQVYRVEVVAVESLEADLAGGVAPIDGLDVGQRCAMKILIPPSAMAQRFRDAIYKVGFQSEFSLQVNPAASRCGALWQKFIRRAAGIEFGDERSVCNILATFVDDTLGACGELSEWLAGRNWRFEVDDNLTARREWDVDEPVEQPGVGSPEYRAKKQFMHRMVKMLHRIGMPEFARQYYWWTCKSQPNCMKRLDCDDDPAAGMVAVDFRAGLALLPVLPMSPGDIVLIAKGLARGALVQFDRGDVDKLRAYIAEHPGRFDDMTDALAELERLEGVYRNSQIDITHNHVRLLYSRKLWGQIFDSTVRGWEIRGAIDEPAAKSFARSRTKTVAFGLMGIVAGLCLLAAGVGAAGLIGLGVGALFGWRPEWLTTGLWASGAALGGGGAVGGAIRLLRSLWGRGDLRRHYFGLLRLGYLRKTLRVRAQEVLVRWVRQGRVSAERAEFLSDSPGWFFANQLLMWLPANIHRFATDWSFFKAKLAQIVLHPVRLYFDAEVRTQWMRDMIADGQAKGMLTDDEAEHLRGRLDEPYIQTYLKALAVHVCTLPVTQVVSFAIAGWYYFSHPEMPHSERMLVAGGIIAAFQIVPISPGSLVRGLYVVYLAIRDRNFQDYKLALGLGFWKYIGYLSFPLQMAYRYPTLARFMAGRFATEATHSVPVFGEHGALMEHAVFDLFYNWPLTLRRRLGLYAERRKGRRTRWWPIAAAGAGAYVLIAQLPVLLAQAMGEAGRFSHIVLNTETWSLVLASLVGGFAAARAAGGAQTSRRLLIGGLTGLAVILLHQAALLGAQWWAAADPNGPVRMSFDGLTLADRVKAFSFPAFFCVVVGVIAAGLSELTLPEPRDRTRPAAAGSVPAESPAG